MAIFNRQRVLLVVDMHEQSEQRLVRGSTQ